MMYLLTEQQHAQIVDALSIRDVRLHESALAMLKAMQPVKPACYGWRGNDGSVRDCIAPDTHQIIEGEYNVHLYAKEQQ